MNQTKGLCKGLCVEIKQSYCEIDLGVCVCVCDERDSVWKFT